MAFFEEMHGTGNLNEVSTMQEISVHIVDAFTKEPFAGNPAAVCLLQSDSDISDVKKQSIAMEMNLSETAFVSCLSPSDTFSKSDTFGLRWFTPMVEVDLCGHATLATATIIFRTHGNQNREIKFETRSGTLLAILKGDLIALDFPQNPGRPLDDATSREVRPLLDFCTLLGSDSIVDVVYSTVTRKLLVRLRDNVSMAELTSLSVDSTQMLATLLSNTVRGVILTVKGSLENGAVDPQGRPYDFISRYFAPWVGIAEDPVTGSSHTVLAPYWSDVLKKNIMYARQCSKRGGDLLLDLHPNYTRVEIAGHSKIVMSGQLTL